MKSSILEGGGSFTTKMTGVKATGHSLIYSIINPEGRKVELSYSGNFDPITSISAPTSIQL